MELAVFNAYYRLKIWMKYLLQDGYLIACWHRIDGIHKNWLLKQPLTTISIITKLQRRMLLDIRKNYVWNCRRCR